MANNYLIELDKELSFNELQMILANNDISISSTVEAELSNKILPNGFYLSVNDQNQVIGTPDYYDLYDAVSDTEEIHSVTIQLSELNTPSNISSVIKEWSDIGYSSFATKLNAHAKSFQHLTGKSKYEIANAQIIETNYHSLNAKVILSNISIDKNGSIINIIDPSIKDKLTGTTSPLDTNGVDLKSFSSSQIQDLLSGKQVTGIKGLVGSFGLSKTPGGWAITSVQKIVSTADNESGI